MKKKIVIAGGTGFIGIELINYFSAENEVIVLTRGKANVKTNSYGLAADKQINSSNIQYVLWDAKNRGLWTKELEAADLLINLCGKTVNCRYTKRNKQEILDSRTQTTAALGEAIQKCVSPPKLWINASSATIYRHATDKAQDEYTGEIENDFSVQVCKQWEQTLFGFRTPFTRKVALRMAVTLGNNGVIVPYFNLIKFGLGGRQGCGMQMYSWVHIYDTCRIIDWLYEHKEMEGIYNCSSPNPISNKEFMETLRRVTGSKFGLPAYEWMLRLGAALIGTETELVLKSRWVVPTKLLQSGFTFKYEQIENAFTQIVNESPRKNYRLF